MNADAERPETLTTAANEIEAATIVNYLKLRGINAFAAGGYTSGFRAEAPGRVAVLVKHLDFDRAKQALAEIQSEQGNPDEPEEDSPKPKPSALTVKFALITSFVLITGAGGWLFCFAALPDAWPTAAAVTMLFIVIMAVVHWIGYFAWKCQYPTEASGVVTPPLSKDFLSNLKTAVIVQFVLLILTALMLDGGWMCRLCMVAIVGHWVGIGVIAVRRGAAPTKLDLLFMRYGAAVLTIAAPFIANVVYGIIGESYLSGLERLLRHR